MVLGDSNFRHMSWNQNPFRSVSGGHGNFHGLQRLVRAASKSPQAMALIIGLGINRPNSGGDSLGKVLLSALRCVGNASPHIPVFGDVFLGENNCNAHAV